MKLASDPLGVGSEKVEREMPIIPNNIVPSKTIWTDDDFVSMNWHDNALHAFAFEPATTHPGSLHLDLDYILEWISPTPPVRTFSFWVCPATLVFDHAWDLTADFNLKNRSFECSLDAIERVGPDEHGAYSWTLTGQEFIFHFDAMGFSQYLRRPPIRSERQRLSLDERGGLSFDPQGYVL